MEKVETTLLQRKHGKKSEVKITKRRWIVMAIFVYYACVNSIQWIEYSSITNLVVKYYKVSTLAVDWTSIVYMAIYPFLVIPASYITDKKGLRAAGVIGCVGTLIGTSIKVLSIRTDLFWLTLLGQTILAASQVFIVALPPKIASIWFPPSEVSVACSIGVFGSQFGVAIGYVLPPIIIQNSEYVGEIASGLKLLCWILTISMVPVTLALCVCFPNQPTYPPSITQANIRKSNVEFEANIFFKSIKNLFTCKGFVIHMLAYSINTGVFSAVGTLLNQFILEHFEGAHEDAGRMGFFMVLSGNIAIISFGIVMDKTHKYKEIALASYFFSTVSVLILMYSLEYRSQIFTYIACGLVGVFTNGYMPAAFELATELTFPSEESTTTGIIMASSQILGAVFTVCLGYLNLWIGCFWSLATQVVLLTVGTVITAFVPNNLLRQDAFNSRDDDECIRKLSAHGSRLTFAEEKIKTVNS